MSNSEADHYTDQESGLKVRYFPEEPAPEEPSSYPIESVLSRTDELEQLLLSLQESKYPPNAYSRRSDQRQYSRCAISEERTSGILTLNGRSYDCLLVEMSIGGFGVIVPGVPRLICGSEGRLRAPGLDYIVRMTRQEIRSGGTYIGLRQIEEILDSNPYYPNSHPPIVNYLIAAVAGGLIATFMYYFKMG